MNKIKPYLFWIVCGIIILVELVLLLAISPASSDGTRSPAEVAQGLNNDKKVLDGLFAKAKAGSPAGETFDPEKPESIGRLYDKWLPTDAWKPVLARQLEQYAQQQTGIHEFLVKRSQALHAPISSETGKADWYWDYETKTAELLQRLYDHHCLVMPAAAPAPATAPGPGGATAEATGTPAEPAAPDFKKNAAVRGIAGFLTTITPPESDSFPEHTIRFRIMELVAKALIDSKATNEKTPIAPGKDQFETRVMLDKGTQFEIGEEASKVTLQLQGPVSSLLAALAALEENRDETQPIKVVTGVSLYRFPYTEGQRRDIPAENAMLKLTLVVLDFSKMPAPKPLAPVAPPAPPAVKKPAPRAAAAEAPGDE